MSAGPANKWNAHRTPRIKNRGEPCALYDLMLKVVSGLAVERVPRNGVYKPGE